MSLASALSPADFGALMEVGKGFAHTPIQARSAARLMHLGLIHRLFESHRITTAGKARLAAGM